MENNEKEYLQVPYLNSWNDELGFMTHAMSWYRMNRKEGVQYYGVRQATPMPEPFTMYTTHSVPGLDYDTIELTLKNGQHVVMTIDTVIVYDGPYTRKLLKRYLRFVVDGAWVWRISKEVKEVYHANLGYTPSHLNQFIAQFVHIAVEIIKCVPGVSKDELSLRNNRYRSALLNGSVKSMLQLQHCSTPEELWPIHAEFYRALEIAREWGKRDKLQSLFQGNLTIDTAHDAISTMINRVRPHLPRKTHTILNIKLADNDPNPSATVERLIAEHRSQFQDSQDEHSE